MNANEPNKQQIAMRLLDQIIEKNQHEDKLLKQTDPDLTGDSWNVFNLKTLRELLNQVFAE